MIQLHIFSSRITVNTENEKEFMCAKVVKVIKDTNTHTMYIGIRNESEMRTFLSYFIHLVYNYLYRANGIKIYYARYKCPTTICLYVRKNIKELICTHFTYTLHMVKEASRFSIFFFNCYSNERPICVLY